VQCMSQRVAVCCSALQCVTVLRCVCGVHELVHGMLRCVRGMHDLQCMLQCVTKKDLQIAHRSLLTYVHVLQICMYIYMCDCGGHELQCMLQVCG